MYAHVTNISKHSPVFLSLVSVPRSQAAQLDK